MVLLYAKKSEKFKVLKEKLAEILNESNVFTEEGGDILEADEDEIPIPKSSFATADDGDDVDIPKQSFETATEDTAKETAGANGLKQDPVTAADIRLALPTKGNDGTYTFFAEVKDEDKLDSVAGLKDGDDIAFAVDEDEFEITAMKDEEEEDE